MTTATITLTPRQQAFIERELEGFASVPAYFEALLHAEWRRKAEAEPLKVVEVAETSGPASALPTDELDQIRKEIAPEPSKPNQRGRVSWPSSDQEHRRAP